MFKGMRERREAERRAQEAAERARQQRIEEYNRQVREAAEAKARTDAKEAEIEAVYSKCPQARAYRLKVQQTEVREHMIALSDFYAGHLNRFVAFDLETTGVYYATDAIVEIGAVRVESGQVVARFQRLVNPGRPMPMAASQVNHITDRMLVNQPRIHQVLPEFLAFVGDDVLVAYNAGFDLRFLAMACMRDRFRFPTEYFDAMAVAKYWPGLPDRKLTTLAAAAGIAPDDAHRALADAETVAALVLVAPEKDARNKAEQRAAKEAEKAHRAEAALQFQIMDDDRMLYATRCGIPAIRNQRDFDAGYRQGSPSYYAAEELRKVGRYDDAIIMLNKARALGYEAPALYTAYVTIYRKLKDYRQELAMIDEFLSRKTYGKEAAFLERREKVLALIEKNT